MGFPNSSKFFAESPYYKLIEEVIWHIHQNMGGDLSLKALAKKFKVSEFYLQRIFKHWAGISAAQYIRYLKFQNAKAKIRTKSSLSAASNDSGFSSSSRLHDLFVNIEAVTPLQYKQMGKGGKWLIYG